jgi:hypothetical protein
MEDKITIIEGPTPVFEDINDGWAIGLNESPILYDTIFTEVRTYNGPALVERCHRAWKKQSSIYLHYKNEDGLEEKAPIVAARSVDSDQGQVLMLWLRQLPAYDDIKDLAEGFNQDEFEEDSEEFDDEEENNDDEDDDDEDDSDLGYLN